MSDKSRIGIIGMGVMGKSLALNFARKGVPVSVYNRHVPDKEVNVASEFAQAHQNFGHLSGFDSLEDFFKSLERPRKILLMVTAGPAIDEILKQLLPFLKREDVVMDGGNSFFKDTTRREETLSNSDICYLGVGISGGEEGALKGPSLMPGGNIKGYRQVQELLELAAARDKNNKPCSAYLGSGGAGHFIKMVHNGIEYAEMQLLTEIFDLLKRAFGLPNDEIAEFFRKGQQQGAGGFLAEVTIGVLEYKENGEPLLDKILDRSEQKGTGGWTVQSGMENGMPLSTISESVMARYLSSLKERRLSLGGAYSWPKVSVPYTGQHEQDLITALQTARLINHLSGFDFIDKVSKDLGWNVSLAEVARIWTNGCIIRSQLMEELVNIFSEYPDGWTHPTVIGRFKEGKASLAKIISMGMEHNIAVPVLSASINLLYGMTTANSAANLIQAQRDFFGAHTYQRRDKPENEYFHTEWTKI